MKVIKSRTVRWAKHGKARNAHSILVGKTEWGITLKCKLRNPCPVLGFCGHDNEPSTAIKG
jgi:hypothetical protein